MQQTNQGHTTQLPSLEEVNELFEPTNQPIRNKEVTNQPGNQETSQPASQESGQKAISPGKKLIKKVDVNPVRKPRNNPIVKEVDNSEKFSAKKPTVQQAVKQDDIKAALIASIMLENQIEQTEKKFENKLTFNIKIANKYRLEDYKTFHARTLGQKITNDELINRAISAYLDIMTAPNGQ